MNVVLVFAMGAGFGASVVIGRAESTASRLKRSLLPLAMGSWFMAMLLEAADELTVALAAIAMACAIFAGRPNGGRRQQRTGDPVPTDAPGPAAG